MTNSERLRAMSDKELAEALCDLRSNCYECLGYNDCTFGNGHGNGLLKWLESEAVDKRQKQIFVTE